MAGSISLSSIAALHCGSGLVAAAVPDSTLETVAGFHPALMTMPFPEEAGRFSTAAWPLLRPEIEKQDAVGVGPGMTTGAGSVAIVEGLLRQRETPLVIDADAINVIAEQGWLNDEWFARRERDAAIVLTPHPGELARLTGVSAKDGDGQFAAAQEIATRCRVTIVVKGGPTRLTGVDPKTGILSNHVNDTGNPAMATAGCGDVLTGVITSLLGQGLNAWDASRLGVWIHGRAGDVAEAEISAIGMTARHLVETLALVADEML